MQTDRVISCLLGATHSPPMASGSTRASFRPSRTFSCHLTDGISKLPRPGKLQLYVCERFSSIVTLNHLLEKRLTWCWGPEHQDMCLYTSRRPCWNPLSLLSPMSNYTSKCTPKFFYIGLCTILAQMQYGKERLICCTGHSFKQAKCDCNTTKKECLAMV